MTDIVIERRLSDYLVKSDTCTRQRLLDEGFSIWGTVTFDACNGLYFKVSHPLMGEKVVTPFKDTVKHRPPLERW